MWGSRYARFAGYSTSRGGLRGRIDDPARRDYCAKLLRMQSTLCYKVDMNAIPEDAALSPEQMLGLLDDQRRSVEGQMGGFVPALVTAWGIAWLFGFGALWLIDGLKPAFSLPLPVAVTIFVVLLVVAAAISVLLGVRANRGIRGTSNQSFAGIVYGITWSLGSLAIFGFAQGLAANGMSRELANIFYPVAFVLFAGIMYVVAGAIWRAVPMIVLGVWTVIIGIAAPFFGYPNHYLVLAVGGGVAYLVLGILSFAQLSRVRQRVTRDLDASEKAARRG